MAGTCELCGGKIVNGRCTDCGMDYSRMKNRYHLNENCSDYDLNAREINTGYEKSLKGKGEHFSGAKKEKTVLNGKASVQPNVARPRQEEKKQQNVQTPLQTSWEQTGKKAAPAMAGKKSGKGKKIAIVITVAAMLLGSADGILESIFDHDSGSYEPEYSELLHEDILNDSDLPTLDEDGDSVDFSLTQYGSYLVGVDIPEGTYVLTNMDKEYSASLYVENAEYDISDSYYIDPGSYEDEVNLYDGTIVYMNRAGEINCMSDNAQVDGLHGWTGDVGSTIVTFPTEEENEEVYTVGKDIEPGRYTVSYDGSGTSVISVDVRASQRTSYLSLSDPQYNAEEAQFVGLVLEEGTQLEIQRFGSDYVEVTFTPMEADATVPVQQSGE